MEKLRFSYFQLTFGQEETYLHPERTYERLLRCGYGAIELTPPKGQYGLGVSMEDFVETHRKLKTEYGLEVSCVNECWGEVWDPFSPIYKTLTETKTADLAVRETKSTIDVASELGAPFVTVAVATHGAISADNVNECSATAVDALRRMAEYAEKRHVRLVFEATNHLEMGKYVNTVSNHRRLIAATGSKSIGIQLDWFHANFEELNAYEAVLDAQPLLWHLHFRDSNSLTPGYGNVDFKAVIRALKKTGYTGYCTIESAPMYPDSETACQDGIDYLRLLERIVDLQLSDDFPNGYVVPDRI
ncbi:MAG TPA: sugar phosphate isomerase/epimerase family protein [Spirochaetia bacterium]|nr:sugar phosphate isomerase/epimerase family protein [Spirochaetia bacterium]